MSIYTNTMERVEKQDKLAQNIARYLLGHDYKHIEGCIDDASGIFHVENFGKLKVFIREEPGVTGRETASELFADLMATIRAIENMIKREGEDCTIKIKQQHIEGIPFIDAKIICDI